MDFDFDNIYSNSFNVGCDFNELYNECLMCAHDIDTLVVVWQASRIGISYTESTQMQALSYLKNAISAKIQYMEKALETLLNDASKKSPEMDFTRLTASVMELQNYVRAKKRDMDMDPYSSDGCPHRVHDEEEGLTWY